MRFPSINQFPAPNSYPNAIWPPGVVVVGGAVAFCDLLGVSVPAVLLGVVDLPPVVTGIVEDDDVLGVVPQPDVLGVVC